MSDHAEALAVASVVGSAFAFTAATAGFVWVGAGIGIVSAALLFAAVFATLRL